MLCNAFKEKLPRSSNQQIILSLLTFTTRWSAHYEEKKDLVDGEEKPALEPPYEECKRVKSAILKYFVLTEKSDNKNFPRMIGKKL